MNHCVVHATSIDALTLVLNFLDMSRGIADLDAVGIKKHTCINRRYLMKMCSKQLF